MPERVSETGTLTAINLAIIAVAIVLVILAMIWGARLKRKRAAADAIEEERVEETGGNLPAAAQQPLDDNAATDLPRRVDEADRTPPPPLPVAPAPPPLADTPVVATPASSAAGLADEPVAAASAFAASPASEAEPTPAAPAVSDDEDSPVTLLKGLGPKVAARFAELGITTVGQLAALDDTAAADLDAQLGSFKGRMARDRWIEQARILAAGDRAGFEAVFGKL